MANIIYYAVIALKAEEVEDVISSLNEKGLTDLSKWLVKHKDSIYGELPEDWKPFEDKSISEIIEENETKCYKCQTKSISDLDEDCANTDVLSGINVFFIDVFAMYLQKYQKLAIRVDHAFRHAEESKCCLLMNYALPVNLQDQLEEQYSSTWNQVLKEYEKGSLHRVAARVNDLNNFKNFVKYYLENEEHPSPGAKRAMLKNPITRDIVTNNSKRPNLGGD
jgi:hypothetical protein